MDLSIKTLSIETLPVSTALARYISLLPSRETISRIVNPNDSLFRSNWKYIFVISCAFAVFMDPLFLYVPILGHDKKCLGFDKTLRTVALTLRALTDLLYILDICLEFIGAAVSRIILIDFLAILPIPQVIILMFFTKMTLTRSSSLKIFLIFLLICQYFPRVLRTYQLLMKRLNNSPTRKIRVKGFFMLFIFLLANHVIGALWYFLSCQREMDCWQLACRRENGCELGMFSCDNRSTFANTTLLNDLCYSSNTKLFDFGIFLDAIQSDVLQSTDFPHKLLYCFWWGLRNLSSFGQNLQTSSYAWENLFAVLICTSGMLLVLIYLNATLQLYMQLTITQSEYQRRVMQLTMTRDPQIATWLQENNLPQELGDSIRRSVLEELRVDQDVNIQNIHPILPLGNLKILLHHLCLGALRKVPILRHLAVSDKQLEVMLQYFRPVLYKEGTYIIRQGEPLDKILLITNGTIRTFTTSLDGSGPSSANNLLKKNDFYGEELLFLSLVNDHYDIPLSPRNLKCSTHVDAFVLSFSDLISIKRILAGDPEPPSLPIADP